MSLLKPKSTVDKNEIKRGEQKLKSIIGGKFVHNNNFIRLLQANNIPNTSKTWDHINNQIKHELENGLLTYEDVERRVNHLVLMESPNNRLITLEEVNALKVEEIKQNILSKGKLSIQIPYQSSGIGDVAVGTAVWGKNGTILGALNEGETKWKVATLLFMNEGINVKSTGNTLLYEDIKSIVLGNRGFVHTIVTILTHNGNSLICKVSNNEVSAFKSIIEENIENKNSNNNITELNNNADILLKYADLYDRRLITHEEFEQKKQELLYNNDYENNSLKSEVINGNNPVFCDNCGNPIEENSNFCTNCGYKL